MYLNFYPLKTKLSSSGIRGICIYAKSSLRVSEVVFRDSTFREQLWVEMPPTSSNVLIGCIYRSPYGSAEEDLCSSMPPALDTHMWLLQVILICRKSTGKWVSSAPPSHCSHGFVDLLNDSFLYQHVDRPTRFRLGETPHTLDHRLLHIWTVH